MWAPTFGAPPGTSQQTSLIGRQQAGLARYSGPGHWSDPDRLEVGNGKLTPDENRTHMGMWAILAAPLLAGNNLSQLSPDTGAILTNREIIAIDQDPWARGPIVSTPKGQSRYGLVL
jgi:alpha-galactosidase